MQRSLLIFQNSVKSEETARGYTWYLGKFKEFYKLKDYDSMVTIPQGKLQIMIEDYIMDLKGRINPNSIPTHFYPLQSFFEANDVELRWRKIKKLFPAQIKASGRSAYTNSDIQLLLSHTTNLRNKALIHFLASTGCRIGALPDLKIKNIIDMPNDCKAVLIYEDSTDEYFTFLTSEAWNVLDRYLKIRKDDKNFSEHSLSPTGYELHDKR